jgi:Asp-tRNA(Asn)/Glu-tRNA(Gln) amidotransferase A subunit family amidase
MLWFVGGTDADVTRRRRRAGATIFAISHMPRFALAT